MKNENVPSAELGNGEIAVCQNSSAHSCCGSSNQAVPHKRPSVDKSLLVRANFFYRWHGRRFRQGDSDKLTKGDVAILQFLAAAEIIESDLWLQYQELGGVQDDEVATLASKLIPGYPAKATGGNPLYMQDLLPLDSDMSQYIHDNTEDELTHEVFINEYLASKGAEQVNLDQFRSLPSSKATAQINLVG